MLVRVLKTCFTDGALRVAGTEFDWSGKDASMGKHLAVKRGEASSAKNVVAPQKGAPAKSYSGYVDKHDLV